MRVYERDSLPTIPRVGQPESLWPQTASRCLVGEIVTGHRKVRSCFVCDSDFVIALKRWTCYNSNLFNIVVSFMCRQTRIAWALEEGRAGGEVRALLPALEPHEGLSPLWLCRATVRALHALGLVRSTSWFNPLAWQKNPNAAIKKVSRTKLLWRLEGSDELWCWQKAGGGLCRREQWG